MREILTGIFSWPWFSQPHGYNFNGHFIKHANGSLYIEGPYIGLGSNALLTARASLSILFRAMGRAAARLSNML